MADKTELPFLMQKLMLQDSKVEWMDVSPWRLSQTLFARGHGLFTSFSQPITVDPGASFGSASYVYQWLARGRGDGTDGEIRLQKAVSSPNERSG